MNYREFCKSSGVGLLELMLSLLVIAAIILTAARYFSKVTDNLHVTQSVQIVRTLADASFEWLKGNPNFNGFSMKSLTDDTQILPVDWKNKKDPWGGAIFVHPYNTMPGAKASQVEITLSNVPVWACENMNNILENHNVLLVQNCSAGQGYVAYYPGTTT